MVVTFTFLRRNIPLAPTDTSRESAQIASECRVSHLLHHYIFLDFLFTVHISLECSWKFDENDSFFTH